MLDERRFHGMVRRSAPLTYATRCRVVADEVRAWAHGRLRPTDPDAWAAGPGSRVVWALLMAPVPADDAELNWLADTSGVDASDLRALAPAA